MIKILSVAIKMRGRCFSGDTMFWVGVEMRDKNAALFPKTALPVPDALYGIVSHAGITFTSASGKKVLKSRAMLSASNSVGTIISALKSLLSYFFVGFVSVPDVRNARDASCEKLFLVL